MNNKLQQMTENMQSRISGLAYLMWESAGRQQGMAMDYWLKAEQEILTTLQAAATHVLSNQPKTQTAPPAVAKTVAVEAPKAGAELKQREVEASKTVSAPESASPARKTSVRSKSKA